MDPHDDQAPLTGEEQSPGAGLPPELQKALEDDLNDLEDEERKRSLAFENNRRYVASSGQKSSSSKQQQQQQESGDEPTASEKSNNSSGGHRKDKSHHKKHRHSGTSKSKDKPPLAPVQPDKTAQPQQQGMSTSTDDDGAGHMDDIQKLQEDGSGNGDNSSSSKLPDSDPLRMGIESTDGGDTSPQEGTPTVTDKESSSRTDTFVSTQRGGTGSGGNAANGGTDAGDDSTEFDDEGERRGTHTVLSMNIPSIPQTPKDQNIMAPPSADVPSPEEMNLDGGNAGAGETQPQQEAAATSDVANSQQSQQSRQAVSSTMSHSSDDGRPSQQQQQQQPQEADPAEAHPSNPFTIPEFPSHQVVSQTGSEVGLADIDEDDEEAAAQDVPGRIRKFLMRLDGDDTGNIEVLLLRRVMHAAKLPQGHKELLLQGVQRTSKHIRTPQLSASLEQLADGDDKGFADTMQALEGVPDAIITKSESTIEDRLSQITRSTKQDISDNTFKRTWDMVHLVTILFFYTSMTYKNVLFYEYDWSNPNKKAAGLLIPYILVHLFWVCDLALTVFLPTIDAEGRIVKQWREIVRNEWATLLIDGSCLLPIDFILEATDNHIPFVVFRLLKLVKLVRIQFLFKIVNRDIITASTVTFFFQYKPLIVGISWVLVFIHFCAVAHHFIDKYEIEPRQHPTYWHSLVAVCIMLSGSSADVRLYSTADKLLSIPLVCLCLLGQGILVGKLTALVFRNSVSAENYQLMRDTLSIVRHYKVPHSIQREVLSYQMHALNDDVARHMRNLETLPNEMQIEIMLYIKIDAVAKVKMFKTASQDCRMKLAASLKRVVVEPEDEIVRFGDIGTEMYMMAHGYADVILGNGKIVATFTRGDCFGEMALVQNDSKRTATVRALTYCDMWALDKESFLNALASFPEFLEGMKPDLIQRKVNLEELDDAVKNIEKLLASEAVVKDSESQKDLEDSFADVDEELRKLSIATDFNFDHALLHTGAGRHVAAETEAIAQSVVPQSLQKTRSMRKTSFLLSDGTGGAGARRRSTAFGSMKALKAAAAAQGGAGGAGGGAQPGAVQRTAASTEVQEEVKVLNKNMQELKRGAETIKNILSKMKKK